MASSEEARLPEHVMAELPSLVGSHVRGDHDGRGLRVGLACALFNGGITWRLLQGALEGLDGCGVDRRDVSVAWVPGAFELPLVARGFARAGSVDAVVCLGAVIRGETGHYDFVAGGCASGLQQVQLETGMPVVFGVLTTDDLTQALERSTVAEGDDEGDAGAGWAGNKGYESAVTAVEMARLLAGSPMLTSADDRANRSRRAPSGMI
jgi:6,7-dimethyl-8-ribityllumazine synthase